MNHVDLLKVSLPPVSYETSAPNISAELNAEGNALDSAYALAQTIVQSIVPNAGILLEDWERVYATPSPCSQSIGVTRSQRAGLVIAKINGSGTFTKAKAIEIAASVGYSITIKEHRATRVGSRVGGVLALTDWNYVVDIETTGNTVFSLRCGDAAGNPLRKWGNSLLECVMKPLAQSDTVMRFIYS